MHSYEFLANVLLAVAGLGAGWVIRLLVWSEVVPDQQGILAGGGLTVAGILGYVVLRIVDGYNARQLVRQQQASKIEEMGIQRRCDVLDLDNASLRRRIIILESDLAWYQAQHGPGDADGLRRARSLALSAYDGPDPTPSK